MCKFYANLYLFKNKRLAPYFSKQEKKNYRTTGLGEGDFSEKILTTLPKTDEIFSSKIMVQDEQKVVLLPPVLW